MNALRRELTVVAFLLIWHTAQSYVCQQCTYSNVSIVNLPPPLESLVGQFVAQIIPGTNDTSCYHGNSSVTQECGDVGCSLVYITATAEQYIPLGYANITLNSKLTLVQRSCRDPAFSANLHEVGCTPVSLDTPIQIDSNRTLKFQDLVGEGMQEGMSGMPGMQGMPADSLLNITTDGATCFCRGADNCNNVPADAANTMAMTTTTVATSGGGLLRYTLLTAISSTLVLML